MDTENKTLELLITEGIAESDAQDFVAAIKDVAPISAPLIYCRKTFDPIPEIVQLLGPTGAWAALGTIGLLGAYLTRRVTLLAEDHHRRRQSAADSNPIQTIADATAEFMRKIPPGTEVKFGIALPDDRWGTVLAIQSNDASGIARELMLLAKHSPAIENILSDAIARGEGPLGQGRIEFAANGSVSISWFGQDFKRRQHMLPAPPSDGGGK